jgi:diguanylate cyclase (GGDEF)-like protein
MLGRIMRSRAMARAAVLGLTIGMSALAVLAFYSSTSTAHTTSWVRSSAQLSDQWGQVFTLVSAEYEALNDYERAHSDIGREPLISSIGSVEPALSWLKEHGEPDDVAQAESIDDTYEAYTKTLRDLVAAGNEGDRTTVDVLSEQAALSAGSLRKQAVSNITRKRLEMTAYLDEVDHRNRNLRLAGAIIFATDLLQLILSGFVLLSHQRRVERQAKESRHRALHDGLTGIANRVLLADRMEQALRLAGRHKEAVALLLLDLNRFKEINDTLGHHHGDLLLREVANRLCGVVRNYDTVARLGGDEFAVLLPRVGDADHAMEVAERVLAVLQRPAELDGTVVDVSGSIGVAVYPLHSATSSEFLQHADIAMYNAKRGHLGVAMYDPDANQHSSVQLALLSELRQAIDAHELVLYYQPKVDIATGQVRGVEALVRWQHPVRGFLLPGEFIPLAEESDLIGPLTDYVLIEALRQHREWLREGMMLPVAVNLATRCLLDTGFPQRIAELIAEYGTAADSLTLEITESAVITDPSRAHAVLARLRDLGVRLAIDDFGTGYSSMAYLQTMPVHELKIDRRFVTAVHTSRGDEAIVRAVLQLAHALDLTVVAEGVEDGKTLSVLAAMNCDVAQGYHFCRPIPATELGSWLASRRGQVPVASTR